MKVRELIELLKTVPQDLPVTTYFQGSSSEVQLVQVFTEDIDEYDLQYEDSGGKDVVGAHVYISTQSDPEDTYTEGGTEVKSYFVKPPGSRDH